MLYFMLVFETENRIKLSSHNTGQINHPISFLFKKPMCGSHGLSQAAPLRQSRTAIEISP